MTGVRSRKTRHKKPAVSEATLASRARARNSAMGYRDPDMHTGAWNKQSWNKFHDYLHAYVEHKKHDKKHTIAQFVTGMARRNRVPMLNAKKQLRWITAWDDPNKTRKKGLVPAGNVARRMGDGVYKTFNGY